jgi:hypothetical protein
VNLDVEHLTGFLQPIAQVLCGDPR